jgi:hypothetical protein
MTKTPAMLTDVIAWADAHRCPSSLATVSQCIDSLTYKVAMLDAYLKEYAGITGHPIEAFAKTIDDDFCTVCRLNGGDVIRRANATVTLIPAVWAAVKVEFGRVVAEAVERAEKVAA